MTQSEAIKPEFDQADRMRKALREAEMSVQQMAELLECNKSSIANWLSGRNPPFPGYVKLWAIYTGVDYEWLRETPAEKQARVASRQVKQQ